MDMRCRDDVILHYHPLRTILKVCAPPSSPFSCLRQMHLGTSVTPQNCGIAFPQRNAGSEPLCSLGNYGDRGFGNQRRASKQQTPCTTQVTHSHSSCGGQPKRPHLFTFRNQPIRTRSQKAKTETTASLPKYLTSTKTHCHEKNLIVIVEQTCELCVRSFKLWSG